jgi:hypothetical protein
MWGPQCLTTLWASMACYRDNFTFLYIHIHKLSDNWKAWWYILKHHRILHIAKEYSVSFLWLSSSKNTVHKDSHLMDVILLNVLQKLSHTSKNTELVKLCATMAVIVIKSKNNKFKTVNLLDTIGF